MIIAMVYINNRRQLKYDKCRKGMLMKQDTSRLIIENIVKNALKEIKDSPGRGLRNLVDMALHFSEGRFQRNFFDTAQRMLENDHSAYYDLIEDLVMHADMDRLLTFGMNLGYNSCTIGAKKIREIEAACGYNIPWTIAMELDLEMINRSDEEDDQAYYAQYDRILQQGEELGVYTWMIFCHGNLLRMLPLIEAHADSAFILFCEPDDITRDFLDEIVTVKNLILSVHYTEMGAREDCMYAAEYGVEEPLCSEPEMLFSQLRKAGILYTCHFLYTDANAPEILDDSLFYMMELYNPAFAVLIPKKECSADTRRMVSDYVEKVRNEQNHRLVVWELEADNRRVDGIISDDACGVFFDAEGQLWGTEYNIYQTPLQNILKMTFPK